MRLCKFFICLIASGAALACGLQAQTAGQQYPVGSIIRGFTLSEAGEDGQIRYEITGREATVMGVNRIKITGLKIVFYKDFRNRVVESEITSPESDYYLKEGKLTTVKGVVIKRPNMTITATEMDWTLGQDQGSLRKNVNVSLKGDLIRDKDINNENSS